MRKLIPLAAIVVVALVAFTSGSSPPASAGIVLPPGGFDEFEINGEVTIDLSPLGPGFGTETVPLNGHMAWTRSDPVAGMIDVEIVALQLTGDSTLLGGPTPLKVALNPFAPASIGQIDASAGFPAESFFDIQFPDVFIGEFEHFADELPVQMTSTNVLEIPPFGAKFDSGPQPHPLHDSSNPSSIVGTMSGLNIDIKPPPKSYTITVLKRNGDDLQGLPGWEINLYAGPGCSGPTLDSGLTDSDGLIEFTGLQPGFYSVEEKLRPGWNADGPLCKDTAVGIGPLAHGSPSPAGALTACPVSPDLPFPDAGCDEFSSVATVRVELDPATEFDCDLSGPTQVTRSAVGGSPNTIQTEIVAMQLSGLCQPGDVTVEVRESATQASTGAITEQKNNTPGTLEFPADSFFDVFFEIDTPAGTMHNNDPLTINCKIDEIPPYGCFYEPDVGVVQLFDATCAKVGRMIHAAHIPIDPKKKLVIFTNTPKGKLYTITVLKRHGETKEGLPGWEINLYGGPSCSGLVLSSGLTGADGLIEFGGLISGTYSVEEKLQPGWNPEGPLCKQAAVGLIGPLAHESPGPSGEVVLPTCPISPNLPFPDAGCDEFSSAATVKVELTNPPVGDFACDLSGPTVITRGPVETKPPDSIDTEIVAMQLEGTCQPGNITVKVRESAMQASTGRIVEQNNSIPGTLEFPADSFFDVFFEIDTPIGKLHNNDPLRLRCKIDEIPPYGCFYEPDVGQVQLFDETGKKAGSLTHAAHIPIDPKKKLIVFVNVPKPENVLGDVNCSGAVSIPDAQLIAQLVVGRITVLDCQKNGDVNGSGNITIVDAQLIAQLVIGRISSLPG